MEFIKSIIKTFLYVILSILLGIGWHYIYELTNESWFIGLFAPINESTWEHLKLLFYPVLLISILEYICKKRNNKFIVARTKGILLGMISIVVLFYTYMGVIGINNAAINIIIYIIGVFVTYGSSGIYYNKLTSTFLINKVLATTTVIILIIAFGLFTYLPPHIQLFIPPVS